MDHAYTDWEIEKCRLHVGHVVKLAGTPDSKGNVRIDLNRGYFMTVHESTLSPLTPFDIGLLKRSMADRYGYAIEQARAFQAEITALRKRIQEIENENLPFAEGSEDEAYPLDFE